MRINPAQEKRRCDVIWDREMAMKNAQRYQCKDPAGAQVKMPGAGSIAQKRGTDAFAMRAKALRSTGYSNGSMKGGD
jgi:hypothetical protein